MPEMCVPEESQRETSKMNRREFSLCGAGFDPGRDDVHDVQARTTERLHRALASAQPKRPLTSRKRTTIADASKRPALIMALARPEFDVLVSERAARQ